MKNHIILLCSLFVVGCLAQSNIKRQIKNLSPKSWLVDLGPGYVSMPYKQRIPTQQYLAALEAKKRGCKKVSHDTSIKTKFPLNRAMVYRCYPINSFGKSVDEIIRLHSATN